MELATALITFDQAKSHLEMDHDLSDQQIADKALQASAIILDYLKLPSIPEAWGGAEGDSPPNEGSGIPGPVQAATLLVLGELYKNREAGEVDVISLGIENLLRRQRDPALA